MRHTTFYGVAGLFSLLFTACQKETTQQSNSDQQLIGGNAVQKKAVASAKDLVLQTFTHDDAANAPRQYQFVYSSNGNVDSIVVTGDQAYVYRVFYKGARLDSVNLVQNGAIVSTIRDFQYHGNLITGFNNFDRTRNAPIPTAYAITYDHQKRIRTIERAFQNTVDSHQEFTYDASDNVIEWSETGALFSKSATYSYDVGFNPLHFVPDLFAIVVEEQWIWNYAFSLHNSVSKAYSDGVQVTYQNRYNPSGQLVTKTFTDANSNGSNTFSFTYR